MPLNLTQGVAIVGDTPLQNRVALGFYFVAREVLAENTGVTGHEQRANFARSIILQDYQQFLQYTALVVTDSAIVTAAPATAGAVTDAQILTAIRGMWNRLAAVPET